MCEIATALMIGSTLMSAVGTIQQANAQSKAARYNAQVSEMNATLAERRARDAMERGAREEQKKRQEVAGILGQQRASMAANGLDLGFGSPLDLMIDTAVAGEMDALTIRSNTYREAYDYRVDAAGRRADAGLQRAQASAAKTGGYLSAAGTLLGGGASAWERGEKVGIW